MAADDRDTDQPTPAAGTPPPSPRADPVLPDVSSDERDIGWGDEPSGHDDEWYRRERPPHHGE